MLAFNVSGFPIIPSNSDYGVPGTTYGFSSGGLEGGDTVTLSADRRTVTIHFTASFGADQLRIITARTSIESITSFTSSAGDFSSLSRNADTEAFTLRLKNGNEVDFDPDGLQTALIDRNGNTTSYGYDAQQRLTTITDPTGEVTALAYSGEHLDTITDPAGRVTTFTHASEGNLIQVSLVKFP